MTEPAAKAKRLSRRALRAWSWLAAGLAFASPFAALATSPKPAVADQASGHQRRPVVIVRKITRRVVVRETPGEVRYVYVTAPSGSSSSAGYSTSSSSSSGPSTATTTSTSNGSGTSPTTTSSGS